MNFIEDRPVTAPEEERTSVTLSESKKPQRKAVQAPKKHTHIKRERKFAVLALLLVVSILLGTAVRAALATPYITYKDIVDFTGVTCVLTDRFDQPIYENGAVTNYKAFGNLIGHEDRIHNALLYRHAELLMPDGVNPLLGYTSLETAPRVMHTTLLSEESQQEIVKLFGGKSGCCFSYNYETGEVYTALSFPAYDPASENPTYINRCFNSVYIPGSTMKIVTAALAIDQGKNVGKLKYVCEGTVKLSDGKEIKCAGVHGRLDFASAIGKSCNSYFAQLIAELNLEKALDTLAEMGFSVNGTAAPSETVDGLSKENSSTNVTNTSSFKNIWGLIGQGHTQVNPIDMARIAAAVVNGGEAAQPYVVSAVVNPNKGDKVIYEATPQKVSLLSSKTADKTAEFWKKGVDANYYTYQGMSDRIDYAKTGTAEQGDGTEDKLLVGVIEASKTAFYIVVENNTGSPTPMMIANKLAELLPTN